MSAPEKMLRDAAQAVIDSAGRPGRRAEYLIGPEGEIWHDYQEVGQPALDALAAALSARPSPPKVDVPVPEPVAWVSPGQFANMEDEGEGGTYLPTRRTRLGNFTMPLYAAPIASTPRGAEDT